MCMRIYVPRDGSGAHLMPACSDIPPTDFANEWHSLYKMKSYISDASDIFKK